MITKELAAILSENGFKDVKVLNGKVCATFDYMTTRGICVDIDEICTRRRYCYQDREEATREFAAWDGRGHPGGNWIKVKGLDDFGNHLDNLNPNWSRS